MPDQERVHGAEQQLARRGHFLRALYVLQEPARLQAAEIRAQGQPGRLAKLTLSAGSRVPRDFVGHARVLPDNRVRNGLTGLLFPKDGCLALVGNPDRGKLTRRYSRLAKGGFGDFDGAGDDLGRFMLHPARFRVDLPVFFLRDADDAPFGIEHHETRAGGALVDRCYIPFHVSSPRRVPVRSAIPGFWRYIPPPRFAADRGPSPFRGPELPPLRERRPVPRPNRTSRRRSAAPASLRWSRPSRNGSSRPARPLSPARPG